ncbi:MAG: hypothetical protein H8E35_03255 [Ardenticatenia bacterium]|nr:hypothetical protein [Ardenticatenia bacterium]
MPHRGYSARGGMDVDAFQQWAVDKIPVVVMGDYIVHPGRGPRGAGAKRVRWGSRTVLCRVSRARCVEDERRQAR